MSPVKYEMGFYIPEDGTLPSHHRDNLKSHRVSWHPFSDIVHFVQLFSCGIYGERSGIGRGFLRVI
jgi:hypothetical protein